MKIKSLLPLAALALFLGACTPYYYIPNTQNVPMVKEKGGNALVVAGNGNQFELQGAYGITDNLALQLNGGFVFPNDETDGDGGTGKIIEAGIGYYKNISPVLLFDVYALAGGGQMENHFPSTLSAYPATTGKISAGLARFSLQPSLSYHTKYFSVSASTRLSSLNYGNIKGSLIFGSEDQVVYLTDNKSNFLIEPALTLRAGLQRVKLQLQLLKSFNLSNSDFSQEEGLVTIGLHVNI